MEEAITLATVGGGALAELFGAELDRILENIGDPNTRATAKRAIKMEVVFKPNKERTASEITLKCVSVLAGIETVDSYLYIGKRGGKYVAVENDPKQSKLFDQERPLPMAVSQFQKPKGGE
jgi:hypothetical protein